MSQMKMFIIFYVELIASLCCGCSSRHGSSAAFEQGEPTVLSSDSKGGPLPLTGSVLRIVKPIGGDVVKPRGSISCVVELVLAESTPMPELVRLELLSEKDNRFFDGCKTLPAEKLAGRRFRYSGELTAPPGKGKFLVQAVAHHTTFTAVEGGAGKAETARIVSPRVDIEVKP